MPLRDFVLAEMRAQGGVVTAYTLASLLSAKRRRRIAPNSVYRVLNDLIAEDCVRRVEIRNGFIVAPDAEEAMIAVCNICEKVFWLDGSAARQQLRSAAKAAGFKVTRLVTELVGSCESCSGRTSTSTA